jgi:hypothetical protein
MRYTSRVPSPTVAGHTALRFRFVFADARKRAASVSRRMAVAEYVDGWMGARIVGERQCDTEVIVYIEVPRPVPIKIAAQFIRDCPHYVRDTFAACGQASR